VKIELENPKKNVSKKLSRKTTKTKTGRKTSASSTIIIADIENSWAVLGNNYSPSIKKGQIIHDDMMTHETIGPMISYGA
jgi:hypothetical protein